MQFALLHHCDNTLLLVHNGGCICERSRYCLHRVDEQSGYSIDGIQDDTNISLVHLTIEKKRHFVPSLIFYISFKEVKAPDLHIYRMYKNGLFTSSSEFWRPHTVPMFLFITFVSLEVFFFFLHCFT